MSFARAHPRPCIVVVVVVFVVVVVSVRYAPQLRSLRRGVDHNLLGLMVPLTAFDDDDALPRDEQSYSVLSDDDVPVLEVMCEVKSGAF